MMLNSSNFLNDPEVKAAKDQLLKAVLRHQKNIVGIKPPDTALKESYENILKRFEDLRGMPLWYPYIGSGFGKGALVELADGSIKYDFISGVGVHFGHSHPLLISASIEAALQDTVMQGNLQQNMIAFELSELLVKSSKIDHCFLTTSGAMAVENGLKIIFQKKFPKSRVLAFDRNFSGRTIYLTHVTDKPAYREGLPQVGSVDYIPFFDEKDPKGSTQKAIDALKKALHRYPGEHACMIMELIQGEAGFFPGDRDFFKQLIQVLKDHDIAVLIDEVQTFGRLETLFAFQHFGLEDVVDVVTVGKLLNTCAILYRQEFTPKPGFITQTYISSTSALFAARAVVKSLLEEGYLGPNGKNAQISAHFMKRLRELEKRVPDRIQGPYGMGLMVAFSPLGGDPKKVIAFAKDLFDAGVIAFPSGETPMRIRCHVPPGAVTFDDIDRVVAIIEETLIKW